jgi:excisionase family DNA binding protein
MVNGVSHHYKAECWFNYFSALCLHRTHFHFQMEQMRLPKSYKTPKQMAEELDVSEKTIYRMCQSGQLPSYRIGGRWRIYEEAELLVEDSDMVLKQFKQGMKKAGW